MSPETNGRAYPEGAPLVFVRVEDSVDPRLTGRPGGVYESPPQTRQRAMSLVHLLLGRPSDHSDGESTWVAAIAGGRRTISVEEWGSNEQMGGNT